MPPFHLLFPVNHHASPGFFAHYAKKPWGTPTAFVFFTVRHEHPSPLAAAHDAVFAHPEDVATGGPIMMMLSIMMAFNIPALRPHHKLKVHISIEMLLKHVNGPFWSAARIAAFIRDGVAMFL
jgi:hypothetical protein